MRRSVSVAILSALLLAIPSGFAQRSGHASGGASGGHFGGGSIGGGHASGFGGGISSGSFGRSSGIAPHSFASAPQFTSTAPSRAFVPGYRVPYTGPTTERRPQPRNGDHYRSPYRGAYPHGNSWEILPWDLGYSDFTGYNGYGSGYDSSDASEAAATVAPSDDGYRQDYQEPGYQDGPPPDATSVAAEPELTLIFNDGHREAIHNYVLTAKAVIVLDQAASGRQQRIPLASLDLPSTQQAAQQAGLDFTPPASPNPSTPRRPGSTTPPGLGPSAAMPQL
jgi:hypothetical protein